MLVSSTINIWLSFHKPLPWTGALPSPALLTRGNKVATCLINRLKGNIHHVFRRPRKSLGLSYFVYTLQNILFSSKFEPVLSETLHQESMPCFFQHSFVVASLTWTLLESIFFPLRAKVFVCVSLHCSNQLDRCFQSALSSIRSWLSFSLLLVSISGTYRGDSGRVEVRHVTVTSHLNLKS